MSLISKIFWVVLHNWVILLFVPFIAVLVVFALKVLSKKGPGNPWVHTITEALPVVGLIGTFFGAIFVVFDKSMSNEGVIIAFIISVTGWVGYLLLQFFTTYKNRAPEQTLLNTLSLTKGINSGTTGINEKLLKTIEALTQIDQKVNSIAQAGGYKQVSYLKNEVTGLNTQLEKLSLSLSSCKNSLSSINSLISDDFSIRISSPPDMEGLVHRLESINNILEKIEKRKQEHNLNINYASNIENLDQHLKCINDSLCGLAEIDKNPKIEISLPNDIKEKIESLERFLQTTKGMAQTAKEHTVELELKYDSGALKTFEAQLENILSSLTNLTEKAQIIKMDLDLPDEFDSKISSVESIEHSLSKLGALESDLKFDLKVDVKPENIASELTDVHQSYLPLIGLEKDLEFRVGLKSDSKLPQTLKEIGNIPDLVTELNSTMDKLKNATTFNPDARKNLLKMSEVLEQIAMQSYFRTTVKRRFKKSRELAKRLIAWFRKRN